MFDPQLNGLLIKPQLNGLFSIESESSMTSKGLANWLVSLGENGEI